MKFLSFPLLVLAFGLLICAGSSGDIIELFDEDEEFINSVPNQDTATDSVISEDEVYYGEISIRLESTPDVNNGQKYNPNVPGWGYSIVKSPAGADEARWIMFAWKKVGGEGIMIQFPSSGTWGVQKNGGRYFAGVNAAGWEGIQVSDDAPEEWEVHIRDLYDDFD